jgi:hypothetical protein
MHNWVWVLYAVIGWIAVVPSVAASVVCLSHLGRSRWVSILLAGFGAHAGVSILERLAALIIGQAFPQSATALGLALAAGSSLIIVADAVVVWALAGLLSEMRAKNDNPC